MNPDKHLPEQTKDPTPMVRPSMGHTPPAAKKEGWRSMLSTLLILILAPIIAWLMISFIFQSYEVDGPSMESTLHHHDRLIVWKAPKTWSRLTSADYIPKRYEIIVFTKRGVTDFENTEDRQLIKRVMAVAGERVTVRNGAVTVYNPEFPNGFNPDNDQDYAQTISYTDGNVDLLVPEGEVFVLGDNRRNSQDSRIFGTVSSSDIVGELALRILPLHRAEAF